MERLEPKTITTKDLAVAAQGVEEKKYWLQRLSGEPVKSVFPYDRQDAVVNREGRRYEKEKFVIAGELYSKLEKISNKSKPRMHMLLTAGLLVLIRKYSYDPGQDVMIGVPVYKPPAEAEKKFLNTVLVLREPLDDRRSFKELLLQVKQTILEATENVNYPMEILPGELGMPYTAEEDFPLFDISLMLENIHDPAYIRHIHHNMRFTFQASDGVLEARPTDGSYSHPSAFGGKKPVQDFLPTGEGLSDGFLEGEVEYNSQLYYKETIVRIIRHFTAVMGQVLSDVNLRVADIEILSEEEKEQLLKEFNKSGVENRQGKTIHQWFEEQAEQRPGRVAVSSPLEVKDIFIAGACFRIDPYLYKSDWSDSLKLVKTHRHNNVLINSNMHKLLERFDGNRSLETIFNHIKESPGIGGVKFILYPVETGDLLEITHSFKSKARVYSAGNFADFSTLVRGLYENHLLELAAIKNGGHSPGEGEVKPVEFDRDEGFDERRDLSEIMNRGEKIARAKVLLLGDTPGVAGTGLLYLGAYLRRKGVTVRCRFYDESEDYDSMKAGIEALLDRVQPGIAAIGMKWFLYIARVLEMARIIKDYSREKGKEIKVVVGGNTASYYWQEVIKNDQIDYLVQGDGEEPLLRLSRGEDEAAIPNLVYKKGGEITRNPITYIQEEAESREIYLSHLEEILLWGRTSRLGTFYIYTHKGCAMNCLYCGGCRQAQRETFNREKVLKRGIDETRKDILAALEYASTFHFEFDYLDEHLEEYCRQAWEGIELSRHFCMFSTLSVPTPGLIRLVSRTFNYVYWDFDVCTLSERHRQQLYSLGLVKPQPSDKDILDFLGECEKYRNIEVRLNLITGMPYFTPGDIEASDRLLTKISETYACFGELHWARLHAQPGAPIIGESGKHSMHSYASTYADFLRYSEKSFNRRSGPITIETFEYPYIYYQDDRMNSMVTNFYLETNKKLGERLENREKNKIISGTLTYRQLSERAGGLAEVLKAKGVGPGDIVGLMVERTVEIPVGILGILKTGAAYMPMDPGFPPGRIEYMLGDSNAKALVTTRSLAEEGEKPGNWEGETILLGPAAAVSSSSTLTLTSTCRVSTANPAYVIYTSGTTGKPKGVVITHANLANYVGWFTREAGINGEDKTILTTSYAFDLGYTSLYPSILKGGELHILPRETYLLADRLLSYLKQKGITYLKVTPSLLSIIVESPHFSVETCKSLRLVVVGGESIHVEDIEKAHTQCPHLQIMNHYGPTEATIGSIATFVDFQGYEEYKLHPVIGRPVDNAAVYILDKEMNLLPLGVPGELCISGAGVSAGYLNNPELTIEKFIVPSATRGSFEKPLSAPRAAGLDPVKLLFNYHSPFTFHHSPLYKTGDLARWRPKGKVEFLGRVDKQVKIRGYRVELGEIENRLRKHRQIEDALVIVKEGGPGGGDRSLCAYIVPKKGSSEAVVPGTGTGTIEEYGRVRLFAGGYAEAAGKNPTQPAVQSDGRELTYGTLDRNSDRLARILLKNYDGRNKLSKEERQRYKRQMLLHGWGIESQEKLKGTTVFVAGAGGGGSAVIMQLALLGIGTIRVCDFDEVELSNLNRQFLHDRERLGMNKALSAEITVKRINPHVKLIPFTRKLTRENVYELVGDSDLIFDMFDGPRDKFILSECAVARQIPHIIIAMTDLNAYSAILQTPQTPCYHCLFDKKKLEIIESAMENVVEKYHKNPLAVAVPSLFISTGTAITEALKIVLGFEQPAYNKFYYFNQRGAAESLRYTPSYQSMTQLFSEHFRRISAEQGFDWDRGWRGNLVEVLETRPDPGCPVCGPGGKERRKTPGAQMKQRREEVEVEENDHRPTIALLLKPGLDLAVGITAAMKSGKTCVPLEPAISPARMGEILEESESRIILTDIDHLDQAERLREKVNRNIKVLNMDALGINKPGGPGEELSPGEPGIEIESIEPGQPAYRFYTAGAGESLNLQVLVKELYEVLIKGEGPYKFASGDNKPGMDLGDPFALAGGLRDYMQEEVPDYMIPSYFVLLERIPLTPNGKVDLKALPAPGKLEKKAGEKPGVLGNEMERKLAGIWAEVLGIERDRIGSEANFFALGGHSLSAAVMAAQIHKQLEVKLPLGDIFRMSRLRELAGYLKTLVKDEYIGIEPVEKKEYYRLSSAQARLYILQQMELESTGYNMPFSVTLKEEVDMEALERAFRMLISRHDSMRTSFEMVNEEPVQRIHEGSSVDGHWSLEKCQGRGEVSSPLIDSFIRPFDLSRAPLVRVGVIEIDDGENILLVDLHHIISDGTSQQILTREFLSLYRGERLTPLRLRYRDYSEWQNKRKQQGIIRQQGEKWLEWLAGELPVLDLPYDYPRPEMQSFEGAAIRFLLDERQTGRLKELSKQTETTLYMIFLAALTILLGKLGGREDIIIGTPVAARRHADLQFIIGMLVNTLAMRNYPQGYKTFDRFLKEVKEQTLNAYENQEYPFEDLVERLSVPRDTGRNPVFDVLLGYWEREDLPLDITGKDRDRGYELNAATSKFDLNMTVVEMGNRLSIEIEYCTRLFKAETIHRIIEYFKRILGVIVENRRVRLADIEIIGEEEKNRLVEEFNRTAVDFPRDQTLDRLFVARAEQNLDHIALQGEGGSITYRELNEKSDRLAQVFIGKGTGPDTVIGIMVERSLEMVIGVLAILKAGGAYMPIDPGYPQERIDYMLKDSGAVVTLTTPVIEESINRSNTSNRSYISPIHRPPATSLAYVIYTSGSTGRPKGVMLEHRNLVNLLLYGFAFTNLDFSSVLQYATISFDASFHEIFSALLSGGKLHLIQEEERTDVPALLEIIRKNCIKTLFLPMALLKVIFGQEEYSAVFPRSVAHIQTAGEQVVIGDKLRNHLRENRIFLHNHYGPAETHVVTTLTLDPASEIPVLPPIGKPVANTAIYILDRNDHIQPVMVAGELYIAGVQVGRGYLNNPELTAEKFCLRRPGTFLKKGSWTSKNFLSNNVDPQQTLIGTPRRRSPDSVKLLFNHHSLFTTHHSPLYKTGDLARWHPDGNIEFLGRIDFQVKIRGYRVEPGEIEAQLLNHEAVSEAVVIVRKDPGKEKYLGAYVVPRGTPGEKPSTAQMREYLSARLPDYMVPGFFIWLDRMPLGPTGKVDRKALPDPEVEAGQRGGPPADEIEARLIEIWAEALGLEKEVIGPDANFFQLGGHSLLATILATRVHNRMKVKLPVTRVFRTPTVRGLAQYIKAAGKDEYREIRPVEKRQYYDLSQAQKRIWILVQVEKEQLAYNMPGAYEARDLDREAFEKAIETLVKRHESLRTTFITVGGEPKQKIHDYESLGFKVNYLRLDDRGDEERAETVKNLVEEEKKTPFNLETGPLLRTRLLQIEARRYLFLYTLHHIISDGWSMNVMVDEFAALYAANRDGKGNYPAPLRIQYKDYTQWHNNQLSGENLKKHREYWLEKFKGRVPLLELPTDYPRTRLRAFSGEFLRFIIDRETTRELKRIGRENETTLYILLLTLVKVLLYRYTGQTDIIVGTPAAGRDHQDLENQIGFYINMLALRDRLKPGQEFRRVLQEIKAGTLEAFEHQVYPFDRLARELKVVRDPGRNPLFDVVVAVVTVEDEEENPNEGIPESGAGAIKHDLRFRFNDFGQQIMVNIQYNSGLFKKERIMGLRDRFLSLTAGIIANPDESIDNLSFQTEVEKEEEEDEYQGGF